MEEHLGVTQTSFVLTEAQSFQNLSGYDLAVDETGGDGVGGQDGVSGNGKIDYTKIDLFHAAFR